MDVERTEKSVPCLTSARRSVEGGATGGGEGGVVLRLGLGLLEE